MAKKLSRAALKRTPFFWWVVLHICAPLLPIMVGLVMIGVAANPPPPMSLVDDVILALFALALLAGAVCSFFSGCPPPISDQKKNLTIAVLLIVAFVSILFVAMFYLKQIQSAEKFILFQAGLALVAIPVAWKARA